ncbi:MAG: hypothetical protein HYU58_11395 [Proteobacteria bacterium]|nr:hypothetical protein [Pseudomonadota bacterium]
MQSDWDSLFFTYRPHADQQPHEKHLLADIGLVRTIDGGLALAEDPTHRVYPGGQSLWQRVGGALRRAGFAFRPAAPNETSAAGHRR